MNESQKSKIFKTIAEDVHKMSFAKGADYASKTDVLANFKRNAERLGLTPYQVWLVYFMKHVDAVSNAIKSNPNEPKCVTEPMYGRIIDCITYLNLLECLQADQRGDYNHQSSEIVPENPI